MQYQDNGELDPRILGARIREARERLGLSQDELAGAVGKDQRAISEYESGKRKLSAIDVPAFAKALGVSLLYFYEGEITEDDLERAILDEFRQISTPEAKETAIEFVRLFSNFLTPRPRQ